MFYNRKAKNVLKFISPAEMFGCQWREGLPTGNGKVGLNVLGGAGREVVVVNHASLWWQGKTGVLPDVSEKAKLIAKNLKENKYREAETVLTDALIGKGYKPEFAYPLPLCDMIFTTEIDDSISDYSRQINMETAEVKVEYKVKNVRFYRNIFVSRANDIICWEIGSASAKKLSGSFKMEMHDRSNNRMPNWQSFDIDLVSETKTDKDFLVFSCRNSDGTDFGCVAKVVCFGGSLTKTEDKFVVKNADRVFIIAKTFVLSQKESAIEEIENELNLKFKTPYEKFLKEHSPLHAKLVNSTEISLNSKPFENINTAMLGVKCGNGVPDSLLEKLYVFGKYLFACSMGEGISPCGLFNGDYKAYTSTVENYLGLQRLCNFAYSASLSGVLLPIFNRFCDNLDDYKKNSTRLFGCKGIFVPNLEAPESGLPGSTLPGVVMNYNVASYVGLCMFQYYLLTNDQEFMQEKGFEFLENVGLFYEDFFKINKSTNVFENPIGYSCYNTPTNIGIASSCCVGSNCLADFVCAKEVFESLKTLCLKLDKPEKDVKKWQDLISKIPDIEVDKQGVLKEYNGNVFETNNSSPYIPHLFPYNIGFRPSEAKRDFDELVANTIKFRYSNCFGKFSSATLCDMATALATSGDGSGAYEVLCTMLKSFLTSNLMITSGDNSGMGVGAYEPWTSFNIDKNIGLCNCLQNIFVTSSRNNIHLFKTLPKHFTKGSVSNLTLQEGIRADMEFNQKRGVLKLKLKAQNNMSANIFLPNGTRKVKGLQDQTLFDSKYLVINNFSLPANKTVALKIIYR